MKFEDFRRGVRLALFAAHMVFSPRGKPSPGSQSEVLASIMTDEGRMDVLGPRTEGYSFVDTHRHRDSSSRVDRGLEISSYGPFPGGSYCRSPERMSLNGEELAKIKTTDAYLTAKEMLGADSLTITLPVGGSCSKEDYFSQLVANTEKRLGTMDPNTSLYRELKGKAAGYSLALVEHKVRNNKLSVQYGGKFK